MFCDVVIYQSSQRESNENGAQSTPVRQAKDGSIAQLGEHLPYKQRVTGSSPVVPTICGSVVQLVRTLACHARGRGFESLPSRQLCLCSSVGRAED